MSLANSRQKSPVDALLQIEPYSLDQSAKHTVFTEALMHEMSLHYENNPLYQRFCKRHGFEPSTFSGNLADIPPVPVQVFKSLGNQMSSVGTDNIILTLQSSATSGVPSSVMVDKITSKRQLKVMARVMASFLGSQRKPFLILDVDPLAGSKKALGARSAAVRAYLNFATSATYLLESDKTDNLVFDHQKFLDTVNDLDQDQPIILFGFTYVLYSFLLEGSRLAGKEIQLPEGSKVIHIGGWKKLESKKVQKEKFNKHIGDILGISPSDIIDIYGFTEQMGLNYPDCEAGWKHAPAYSEVIVRDTVQRNPIPNGQVGVLEFLTPIPHSYPGNVVITDDLGFIDNERGKCSCGREGTRFKIVGRAQKAEVRGCGDIMAEKVASPLEIEELSLDKSGLNIFFHNNAEEDPFQDDVQRLENIISGLKAQQAWLAQQPVEAIIALIDKASKVWQDPEFELAEFRQRGLSFLTDWCRSDNLRKLADFSLRGRRSYLDGFLPLEGSIMRQIRAVPRGFAAHWLSGNVPVLGMLTLVQSIITKNVNIVKVASDYSHAVPALLSAFEGLEYTTPGGFTIKGDDLLKTIAVIYFGHGDDDLANIMSSNADVRIAWGGADAVRHVMSLQKKWSAQDIIFGPKLSYMVISAESLQTDRQIRKILRRAATDSSVFDQTACASPHTIFVERGGKISPEEFAEALSHEMDKAKDRIPFETMSDASYNDVITIRSLYEFIGDVWGEHDGIWTVLYDEQKGLATPTYSRVITVRPVDDVMDAAEYANEDIQTIGLAATGEKRLTFAEFVTSRGVERCPDIGFMTNFESPWDGMIAMDRMIRWSTLGGPVT